MAACGGRVFICEGRECAEVLVRRRSGRVKHAVGGEMVERRDRRRRARLDDRVRVGRLRVQRAHAAKAQCRIKMIAPRRYVKELAGEDLEDAPLDIRQLLHLLEVARSVLEEDDHEDEQQN